MISLQVYTTENKIITKRSTLMQVSVQTQRKKKNNFNSINTNLNQILQKTQNNQEADNDDSKKKDKIKRLTHINRQLIQTLKKQNDELTKRISKQRNKSHKKSFSLSQSSQQQPKQMESTKKQLSNAYKQIQMYKSILQNLKAKQISTDSLDKINMLQNKIKMQDQAIDSLQKELKFLKNIKDQQQKQLEIVENDQIKKNVQQLQNEVRNLKQKLKISKKLAVKRQELQKKQHTYYMELQRLLRKQNDEYYPGKQTKTKDFMSNNDLGGIIPHTQITQQQWQSAKSQLLQLKKQHQETNKKIQLLTRQKNKQLKSFQQNQLKLKQKLKKLLQVKNKLSQLTKLVTIKEIKQSQNDQSDQNQQEGYETLLKNGKKNYKHKNPNKQREIKKWVIPQGYALEKGKIMPDSIFFSDKTILKNVKKSKIIQINVWTDSQNTPCILQFHYSCERGKTYEGIQPYPYSTSHLEQHKIAFKQGDYLSKLNGKMENGYLMSLTFVSKFGQTNSFGNQASVLGEFFKFEPRPNELPSCLFGAIVKTQDDEVRICHIGCQFIEDW